MIRAMPGPPSDSYFTDEGKPNVWHISSCGKRSKTVRSVFQRLSKRSTANARTLPALMISRVRNIQPEFFRQQQTVILIINALAKIERRIGLSDFANRQFDNVRRWRYSLRNAPVIAYSEQCCLLLCASNRDAKSFSSLIMPSGISAL